MSWYTVNPLIPGTPMYGNEWVSKDPKGANPDDTDKSAWHKVTLCPSCPTSDRIVGNNSYASSVGMGVVGNLKGRSDFQIASYNSTDGNNGADWHRIGSIKLPSLHVNLLDGAKLTYSNQPQEQYMAHSCPLYIKLVDQPYFRHGLQMNLSFTDGHVETVQYSKMKQTHDVGGNSVTYLESDYYWYPNVNIPGGDMR